MLTIAVQSNTPQIARAVEVIGMSIPAADAAGTKAVAEATVEATTRAMETEIYAQPLPASYARYGKTDRTGALLAGETLVERSPSDYLITTENKGVAGKDPTLYAETRHELMTYPAPWREIGFEEAEREAPLVYEDAFNGAVRAALLAQGE